MPKVLVLMLVLMMVSACEANPTTYAAPKKINDTTAPTQLSPTDLPATLVPSISPSLTPTATLPPTDTPSPFPKPSRTPSVEKLRNLPYISEGSTKQILDIYLPTNPEGLFPVLLTIHGGGGDKADFSSFAMRFVRLGYAVVSINHRDLPKDIYPAAIQDVFCALAWMHTNADNYHLNPDHFFALGHSSGGTFVSMLGAVETPAAFLEDCPHQLPEDDWVQGVITFTGIFDYPSAANYSSGLQSYIHSYLGAERTAAPGIWAEASPVTWVDGSEPPFLVVHGEADRNIDPRQSINMSEALEAAGVNVQLLMIPHLDHGGIVWSETALDEVEVFLNSLANP